MAFMFQRGDNDQADYFLVVNDHDDHGWPPWILAD